VITTVVVTVSLTGGTHPDEAVASIVYAAIGMTVPTGPKITTIRLGIELINF
jgi:hypothetical protein